jgi:uncharacterized LabA/DUF88 family protein
VKFVQKGVDVMLSVDLVKLASTNQIGKAVLVAGDSDYVPAIKVAKETVSVTLCYYEGTIHRELFDVCDERVKMGAAFCDDIKIQ